MAGRCFMLRAIVERHIALHHATGYRFRKQSILLHDYARHAERKGEEVVRATTALEWAAKGPSAGTRHGRLEVIRRFARLMHAEDPRHEIPPGGVFGPQPPRRKPYIFTPKQIHTLLKAAGALGPPGSLRPKTYVTMLGLIAATGLRISEALALRLDDITPAGLVIQQTKFRKSRLVPLHPSTRFALDQYLVARAKYARDDDAVFLSQWSTGLCYPTVITTFLALVRRIGIHPGPGKPGPRIHDLRHTFAVRSLEQCAGDREAVARHMLALSTYLGHAHLGDTYWYLQATPQLLADIAAQSESLAHRGAP
jgi:integrase